jgi:hypothetical protein
MACVWNSDSNSRPTRSIASFSGPASCVWSGIQAEAARAFGQLFADRVGQAAGAGERAGIRFRPIALQQRGHAHDFSGAQVAARRGVRTGARVLRDRARGNGAFAPGVQHLAQFAEALHRIDVSARGIAARPAVRRQRSTGGFATEPAPLHAVTGGGQQRVDAAIQVAQHARELVLRTGGTAAGAACPDRSASWKVARNAPARRVAPIGLERSRHAEFGGQRFQAAVEHFELAP